MILDHESIQKLRCEISDQPTPGALSTRQSILIINRDEPCGVLVKEVSRLGQRSWEDPGEMRAAPVPGWGGVLD